MRASLSFVFFGGVALSVSAAIVSCAASEAGTGGEGGFGGGESSTTHFANTSNTTSGSFVGSGGATGSGGSLPDPDAACGLLTQKATGTPVDLYITLDKSSSMNGDKWDAATAGIEAFSNDMASAGLFVALDFFPHDGAPTCDQTMYETPAVAFGALPGNAAAIQTAMSAETPNGMQSPIYTALGGAILGAKNQADAHPGDAAAVLLITDGAPMGPCSGMCCSGAQDPEDTTVIAQIAANGVNYGVKTFVVGLPGVDVNFANTVAAAGGTTSAILVATGDVTLNFENALTQVRGETLPCTFAIPDTVANGTVDTNHVNVLYTPTGGSAGILAQNPDCTGGVGWYYDNPAMPTEIVLCSSSCADIHADYGAEVQILLGCVTVIH